MRMFAHSLGVWHPNPMLDDMPEKSKERLLQRPTMFYHVFMYVLLRDSFVYHRSVSDLSSSYFVPNLRSSHPAAAHARMGLGLCVACLSGAGNLLPGA